MGMAPFLQVKIFVEFIEVEGTRSMIQNLFFFPNDPSGPELLDWKLWFLRKIVKEKVMDGFCIERMEAKFHTNSTGQR